MGNAQWGLFVLVKFAPGSLERNLTYNLRFNRKQKKLKYEAFLKMWTLISSLFTFISNTWLLYAQNQHGFRIQFCIQKNDNLKFVFRQFYFDIDFMSEKSRNFSFSMPRISLLRKNVIQMHKEFECKNISRPIYLEENMQVHTKYVAFIQNRKKRPWISRIFSLRKIKGMNEW